MKKEKAIEFAALMEDYLNIPSFVCETIEKDLCDGKYKETIEYVINRRNEIEKKEDYTSEQQLINKLIKLQSNWNSLKENLEWEINDYDGIIDIETRNIDSEFLRGIAWEAQELLDKMDELEGENKDEQ